MVRSLVGVAHRVTHDVPDVGIHQPIDPLATAVVCGYQAGTTKRCELMRQRALLDAQDGRQRTDRHRATVVEREQHGQPNVVGQRRKQRSRALEVPRATA